MLYSLCDYAALCSLSAERGECIQHPLTYGSLLLQKDMQGNCRIERIFSTDPQDYLAYQVGQPFSQFKTRETGQWSLPKTSE